MGGGIHAGGEGLPKGVMSITDRTTDATDLSVAFTIYGVDGMRERHFDGNRAGSAPAPFAGCTLHALLGRRSRAILPKYHKCVMNLGFLRIL